MAPNPEPVEPTSSPPVKLLDERTVNQIAAGEVIERPASALKELIENSLDAGATRIDVRLRDGGKELIAVRDNGHSMERGDLLLAFRKHATSKIRSFNDLEKVASFGFRGEALASISSVARVRALCRTAGTTTATQMIIEGGEVRSVEDVGAPLGTLIEVVDLFYNVPVREKYLKTTATELRHCLTAMTAIALANPRVSFRCEHNGRELLNVPGTDRVRERLGTLLGPEVARELVRVSYRSPQLQIDGWIGKPALMRKTAGAIHLFINGRPVQAKTLQRVIREAYFDLLPGKHYPIAVIDLELEPTKVDVNVHPAKLWVRLADEPAVLRSLKEAVRMALEENALIPNLELPSRRKAPETILGPNADESIGSAEGIGPGPEMTEMDHTHSQTQLEVAPAGEVLPADSTLPVMTPVALLDRKYIIAQDPKGLYIIDYHAAHERVMYERLKLSHRYSNISSQALLESRTLELSPDQAAILQEHIRELEELGFDIEHFGGTSFVVRAVPLVLGGASDEQDLTDILAELAEVGRSRTISDRMEGYLHTVACHSALRAGEELTPARQRWLMAEMTSITNPYACVHGRPTMMSITVDELDRRFKRTGF